MDEILQQPGAYQEMIKEKDPYKEYGQVKIRLNEKMVLWERLNRELQEINREREEMM